MFNIAPDGRMFIGMDKQSVRLKFLDKIGERYHISFTDQQKEAFRTLELWGMDINQLQEFLTKDPSERSMIKQPGLKLDTLGGNQLEPLILDARKADYEVHSNTLLRVAIKCDKTTEYQAFDKLIEALQNLKVNKFNLITSARNAVE